MRIRLVLAIVCALSLAPTDAKGSHADPVAVRISEAPLPEVNAPFRAAASRGGFETYRNVARSAN